MTGTRDRAAVGIPPDRLFWTGDHTVSTCTRQHRHEATRAATANTNPIPSNPSRRWPRVLLYLALVGAAFGITYTFTTLTRPGTPVGMVLIPAGEFEMGTAGDTPHKNEQPAHRVRLAFYMDETEVTNAQFRKFVEATGYVTTAEKKPDWEEMKKQLPPNTPRPPDDQLVPGSLVFSPPSEQVPTDNAARWWRWVPGACWKHPEGPNSTLEGKDDHPVVHVSWDDANAYAKWAGKQFVWGDEAPNNADAKKANIWQGGFPHKNTKADGYDRTSPVKSYPANGYGLYDCAGNVWEWCSDWYRADAYVSRNGISVNPKGPSHFWDPSEPLVPKRVTRAGRSCATSPTARATARPPAAERPPTPGCHT